ncbi:MAG: hypothetical protein ABR589_10705, partial [Chthoniobacterales bacterium]
MFEGRLQERNGAGCTEGRHWHGRTKSRPGSASWSAALSGSIALLVLTGWTLDVEFLKRIAPGLVAMNPMTAVAFSLAALSLGLFARTNSSASDSRSFRPGQGLAALVALIG